MRKHLLVLAENHLFEPHLLQKHGLAPEDTVVYLREDYEHNKRFCFHIHRVMHFFLALRDYADELKKNGYEVYLSPCQKKQKPISDEVDQLAQKYKAKQLFHFEFESRPLKQLYTKAFKKMTLPLTELPTSLFITSHKDFETYLGKNKRPFMKTFYEWQRKRFKILVDKNLDPVGGRWSFDDENRKPLPKDHRPPDIPPPAKSPHFGEVKKVCITLFADHPGDPDLFWLATNRVDAKKWFEQFLKERLNEFGPYEDALTGESDFVYHSVLTPYLNLGLLTPHEVVQRTLSYAQKNKPALASVEGFIRQIIGWREFIRGIYHHFPEQEQGNTWKHHRRLSSAWYKGQTSILPLKQTLDKVLRRGYAHHIERLMIIGSLMNLLQIEPQAAHRWFMEMFVDSDEWVMGPNVYGMALFSDGGIFATKPYICGSNYYKKMGRYKTEGWGPGVDGLYWSFIERHLGFFSKNPRLSMMSQTVKKMEIKKKQLLYSAAEQLVLEMTEEKRIQKK